MKQILYSKKLQLNHVSVNLFGKFKTNIKTNNIMCFYLKSTTITNYPLQSDLYACNDIGNCVRKQYIFECVNSLLKY